MTFSGDLWPVGGLERVYRIHVNVPPLEREAAQQGGGIRAADDDLPAVLPGDLLKKAGRRADDVCGSRPVFADPVVQLPGHNARLRLRARCAAVAVYEPGQPAEGRIAQVFAIPQLTGEELGEIGRAS